MNFSKFTRKVIKYSTITVFTGSGWLLYQIKQAHNVDQLSTLTINNSFEIKQNFLNNNEFDHNFFIDVDNNQINREYASLWYSIVDALRFNLIKRLVIMSKHENRYIRLKSIRQLSKVHSLNDSYFEQISIMLSPRTAVGLARLDESDERLFFTPNINYGQLPNELINDLVKDLLKSLYERSKHPCLEYFLATIFKEFHDVGNLIDHDNAPIELTKFLQQHKKQTDLIPICLESLLHHVSINDDYSKDLIDLNGLILLMEIYHKYKDNLDVVAVISRILSYISLNKQSLDDLYKIGWIKVLADWRRHSDIRISIPASKTLTNLDVDDEPVYQQRLYPIFPSIRTVQQPDIDIIFIHGLLGGVFYTWRQQDNKRKLLKPPQKHRKSPNKQIRIDPDVINLIDDYNCNNNENLLVEYEMILEDLPVNLHDLEIPKNFVLPNEIDDFYTYCWPLDWLSEDVENSRIIGVNYETNLSMWAPICPYKNFNTLDSRCNELIQQLNNAGVGERPIVWVTHSMGGLMVKNLLSKAIESSDFNTRNLSLNTKGIIFYSTPHIGSSAAELSQASSYVLWPSIEVQELRKNSTKLLEMHQQFLDLAKHFNYKLISFVETKPTIISAMKFKLIIVEPLSGNPGIGEYYEIQQDHLNICKPGSRYSFLYQRVLSLIQQILDGSNETI